MKYKDFDTILSNNRLARYHKACACNKRKTLTLYRQNIILSETVFGVVGMFEVALRNAIDNYYSTLYGADWLRDAIDTGGLLDNSKCWKTRDIVRNAYNDIVGLGYCKEALLAKCEFGVWRYMFASHPYAAMGNVLLNIFPSIPPIEGVRVCDNQFIFEELTKINKLRNRIAHQEPLCFHMGTNNIESRQVRYVYRRICKLLQWMNIDDYGYLYGINHVIKECDKLDKI